MRRFVMFVLIGCMLLGLVTGCGAVKAAENTAPGAAPVTGAELAPGASDETAAEVPSGSPAAEAEPAELIVFAAASMTEALQGIQADYEASRKVTLVFTFLGSNDLVRLMKEGAPCDVFISAGQKQMDQIDIAGPSEVNTDGTDLVLQGSRFDLLENKVALAVPDGNPAGITGFDDMIARLREGTLFMAVAAENVPVRGYTDKLFAYFGTAVADHARLMSIGSDVKAVTALVSEAAVDCGIVYRTDAFSAGLEVIDTATGEMCGRVVYPAAAISASEHPEEALAFLEYLRSPEFGAVLESIGFTPLN